MDNVLDSLAGQNPLLEIDTSFSNYLAVRTRTSKDHMVGGRMDYAFDADFSIRQKFITYSGWNRIYKNLVSSEIPNKFKRVFQTASKASQEVYPEALAIVKTCAERLMIDPPDVYVRSAPNKLEIYAISAENTAPVIVLTSGLCDACTKEELQFLIGCECGHIQNNHCIYYMAAPSFGITMDSDVVNPIMDGGKQLSSTMMDWLALSNVTADRAGIICLDKPKDYAAVFAGIRNKGINDIYSRTGCVYDNERIMKMYETIHVTPARSIFLDSTWNSLERRAFAGMEFLNCEVLYNWRNDIEKVDIHTVNKQALEVRCEIILGSDSSGKAGV
ncbi:MAG: M48 family metalloprotease [Oscillospiraceae bacterium]|nr:M48 family metalloprotease [Oscillospiraceae bacterium]